MHRGMQIGPDAQYASHQQRRHQRACHHAQSKTAAQRRAAPAAHCD
jgi:hypothetical protein